MVPNQNSVVFCCKTTMWSCLSGTMCSHGCSRTSSCFGACYHSSFPENLATSSRRFALQPFLFGHAVWNILLPTRAESQADMMVGTFPRIIILVFWTVKWMSWPTHLSGRSLIVVSWVSNLAILPWGVGMTLYISCSLWVLWAPEVRPLLDVPDTEWYWVKLVHQGEH